MSSEHAAAQQAQATKTDRVAERQGRQLDVGSAGGDLALLLQLQRTAGNRAVHALLSRRGQQQAVAPLQRQVHPHSLSARQSARSEGFRLLVRAIAAYPAEAHAFLPPILRPLVPPEVGPPLDWVSIDLPSTPPASIRVRGAEVAALLTLAELAPPSLGVAPPPMGTLQAPGRVAGEAAAAGTSERDEALRESDQALADLDRRLAGVSGSSEAMGRIRNARDALLAARWAYLREIGRSEQADREAGAANASSGAVVAAAGSVRSVAGESVMPSAGQGTAVSATEGSIAARAPFLTGMAVLLAFVTSLSSDQPPFVARRVDLNVAIDSARAALATPASATPAVAQQAAGSGVQSTTQSAQEECPANAPRFDLNAAVARAEQLFVAGIGRMQQALPNRSLFSIIFAVQRNTTAVVMAVVDASGCELARAEGCHDQSDGNNPATHAEPRALAQLLPLRATYPPGCTLYAVFGNNSNFCGTCGVFIDAFASMPLPLAVRIVPGRRIDLLRQSGVVAG